MERSPFSQVTTLHITRMIFGLLCVGVGCLIAWDQRAADWWIGLLAGGGFAVLIILLEWGLRNFSFRQFSHGTIGLFVGFLSAWLLTQAFKDANLFSKESHRAIVELAIYFGFGFMGVMLALRSNREEFSLLIPYVRFRQDSLREQPLLVDTNVIIDGRIPRICATGFMNGTLVVPRFVLEELQKLADSKDEVREERGKRGLEALSQMRESSSLDITIHEDLMPDEKMVDAKLVALAKILGAKLLTNDVNLGKVASVQGVEVLNLNELAQAMRPVVVPGDEIRLQLVKEGKDSHQAVGYLPDGTMIVVNEAAKYLGQTEDVVVAGAVQTSAGRLIFAELKDSERSEPYQVE